MAHLIVVSVDAMVFEDLALLAREPNVGRLMAEGSLVKRVKTIYPSLTHPVHASLISGCPAGETGVANNQEYLPGVLDAPWFNRLDQLRCDTILHAAHRAGLTTCACRWPLTAGGFDVIDYLVPEVMDAETDAEPDLDKLYGRVCSPAIFEEIVRPRLGLLDKSERHPAYEVFSMECAAEIIRRHKPSLLLAHPGMVDHARHRTGLFSPDVDEALRLTDGWIGMLMDAAREAGILQDTNFAIVSDHGHLEYTRTLAPNVFFAERGLLRVAEDGSLAAWDAYCFASGLSAQIAVRDPAREGEVRALLEEMRRAGVYGVGEVLTAAEAKARYGLEGPFRFVLEGDGTTAFRSDWTGPLARVNPGAESGLHHSSHGHMPERGPQPPMLVCGPAFRKGATVETASILDEAPTFAAALGVDLPQARGQAIREILR